MVPNHDHWSAGMILYWVLTRDRDAVLAMSDPYGMVLVDGDNVTRSQPASWDDVLRRYAIGDAQPTEENLASAVFRGETEIIPARREIYAALRRGDLHSWARPNGTGDAVQIGSLEWIGLRLRSLDGRDIAIPVDAEHNPLPLPYSHAEYLNGAVPGASTPRAWPDPLFAAEDAMRFWPSKDADPLTQTGAPHPAEAAETRVYQTGLAGRPTSWHLVEQECRDRYAAGERYLGKLGVGESTAEWAQVLRQWLAIQHPKAPQLKGKTFTNRLAGLLRELQSGSDTARDHRPK
jgi:hypothetical protein